MTDRIERISEEGAAAADRASTRLVVSARGLVKILGNTRAVDGVDLNVKSHETVAIVGPSGAGKSTLLRCLNLLEPPDAGSIELDGAALTGASRKELAGLRTQIGMVFQSFNLFPHLTATENVALAPIHTLSVPKEEARERAHELLDDVGLRDKFDSYPRHLSGGQQQRVAIARALAMRPKLMLFDEPTSALDAEMVSEVLRVIAALAKGGMTMVVVSHEIGFVREGADRVLFMADGKVLEEASPKEFFEDPQHERSRQFVRKIL